MKARHIAGTVVRGSDVLRARVLRFWCCRGGFVSGCRSGLGGVDAELNDGDAVEGGVLAGGHAKLPAGVANVLTAAGIR